MAATFYGWNDVWLERGFRSWSIEDRLEAEAAGAVSRLVFETGGHAPERAHPEAVVGAIAAFLGREAATG